MSDLLYRDGTVVPAGAMCRLRELHPRTLLHLVLHRRRALLDYLWCRFRALTALPGDHWRDLARMMDGEVVRVERAHVVMRVQRREDVVRRNGRYSIERVPRNLVGWFPR